MAIIIKRMGRSKGSRCDNSQETVCIMLWYIGTRYRNQSKLDWLFEEYRQSCIRKLGVKWKGEFIQGYQ